MIVVNPAWADTALARLQGAGETASLVGEVESVDPATPFEERVRFV